MGYLDYEHKDIDEGRNKNDSKYVFLMLPGILMAFGGWFCIIPAMMPGDEPQRLQGLGVWFAISRWMMGLVGPIGVVTLLVSYLLARYRGPQWLWLNWVVFFAYMVTMRAACISWP